MPLCVPLWGSHPTEVPGAMTWLRFLLQTPFTASHLCRSEVCCGSDRSLWAGQSAFGGFGGSFLLAVPSFHKPLPFCLWHGPGLPVSQLSGPPTVMSSHLSGLDLREECFPVCKDSQDYFGTTLRSHTNLIISRSFNLLISAKSLSPYNI